MDDLSGSMLTLQAVSTALDLKGLSMPVEKKLSMLISASPSNAASKPSVYCNESPIKSMPQACSLGMTVQDNLFWGAHIDAFQVKVGRKVGVLRRTSRQLPCAARRMYLVSVIQPNLSLEYAATATITSMRASEVNRVLKLWRRAVRCAARADRQAKIQPLLAQLRLQIIEHRRALQVSLLVHRCNLGTAPQDLQLKL